MFCCIALARPGQAAAAEAAADAASRKMPAAGEGLAKDYRRQEREAVQVVEQWAAAWQSGDPAKIVSYMTEDVQFRLDSTQPLHQGRDRLAKIIGSFISAIESLKMTRLYAIGGETDTIVLTERVDRFVGYAPLVQVAGVFRVKNGKIEEWYDIPLPKDRPPPPPGATIKVD